MKQEFKVYQVNLSRPEHDRINEFGHNAVGRHRRNIDLHFKSKAELAKANIRYQDYNHVADIWAEDLEDVFGKGNNAWDNPDVKMLGAMHSISVGDVIKSPNLAKDEFYLVENYGFSKLPDSFYKFDQARYEADWERDTEEQPKYNVDQRLINQVENRD